MKDETRELLYASGQLLKMGIDRALSQLRAEEDKAAKGKVVDENTWRYYYDLGVKAFHDIAKLAALEMRDEAAEERRLLREAKPVTPEQALRLLKAELAHLTGEPVQPVNEAAKADGHAPTKAPERPKVNMTDLDAAMSSSHQWLIDTRQGQQNPIPHKVRKVLPSMGIAEGEPLVTVLHFREEATKLRNTPARAQ